MIGTQSGGSNDASGTDIALDAQGNVYVVGETNATDFLTMNPLQPSYAGLYDAFVSKLDPHFFVYLPLTVKAPQQIASLQITSPNGAEQWQPGTTHNITWTQSGLSGNVTLQLYKGASLSSQVGTAERNRRKLRLDHSIESGHRVMTIRSGSSRDRWKTTRMRTSSS